MAYIVRDLRLDEDYRRSLQQDLDLERQADATFPDWKQRGPDGSMKTVRATVRDYAAFKAAQAREVTPAKREDSASEQTRFAPTLGPLDANAEAFHPANGPNLDEEVLARVRTDSESTSSSSGEEEKLETPCTDTRRPPPAVPRRPPAAVPEPPTDTPRLLPSEEVRKVFERIPVSCKPQGETLEQLYVYWGVETTADEKDILRRLQVILQQCVEEDEESEEYEQSEASTSSEEDFTRVLPDFEMGKMLQEEAEAILCSDLQEKKKCSAQATCAVRQQH